ncbi:hypothetical protein F3Y22_tig00116971pilonHSYRG00658 [Hibiscus syriacus]|uniref:Uncharacterized protein n=1 Tax=Hibiscus syriacus TaxID=106335 RepID=A0A6A2WI72_HIBSY|nr:hypothetical protein F3Y22_tig00116971pilonHSYRG00658 [Hibiscus syriacus]
MMLCYWHNGVRLHQSLRLFVAGEDSGPPGIHGRRDFVFVLSSNWALGHVHAMCSHFILQCETFGLVLQPFLSYATGEHLVDVTEVFLLLRREKNLRRLKLAYLTILLFLDVLWMIRSAIEDQDDDEDYGADSFLD